MLYLVLGKSGHVYGGLLRTEEEAQQISCEIGGGYLALPEPWDAIETKVRGQGRSPFGQPVPELTTMRVPKSIVHQVREYAIWLSQA